MTSRDYGFLTLRNTTAYQPNGLPVPPNRVLITSTNGAGVFSNSINLSTINVSSLNVHQIDADIIDVSTIQVDTLSASSISTNLITMTNGVITGVSTINGAVYPPPSGSSYWTDNGDDIYNTNSGNVDIKAGGVSRIAVTSSNIVVDTSDLVNLNNNNYFGIVNNTTNSTTNVFISNANVNSGTKLAFTTPFSEWDIYTCSPVGGPDGLIPSTLQIKYNMPDPFTQTNNYVDILTLQPNGDLYLTGKISTNTINMTNGVITGVSTINGAVYPPPSGSSYWAPNGNDIYNSNSGNVGIGTSNPQAKLDVNGPLNVIGDLLVSTSNQSRFYASTFYFKAFDAPNVLGAFKFQLDNSNLLFYTSSVSGSDATVVQNSGGGSLVLTTNTSALYVDGTTSRIGINTSTPQATLDVNGQIRLVSSSATTPAIYFNSDDNTGIYGGQTGVSNGVIGFSANSAERMLITNTDVIISPNPGADFIVNTTYNNNATRAVISNDGTESTISVLVLETGNGSYGLYATQSEATASGYGTTPSTFQIYSYYPNPINVLTIYPDGDMNVAGTIVSGGNLLLNNIYETNSTFVISDAINNPRVTNKVRINITAIGAGGGGGASFSAGIGNNYGGGGGGSGQEVTNIYYMDVSSTIQITIGNGGLGGIGGGPDILPVKRGENGGATTVKSLDGTINIYASGGNGADNNGNVAVNTDFGGNGYYGGGTGGSQVELSTITGAGGASCVLYSIRYGSYRVGVNGSQYNIQGGNGDGPGGLTSGGQGGIITNVTEQASGGGGGSSLLGSGGAGGVDSDGANGTRGGGGGGGAVNSATVFGTYYYGGNGGNGCVQIQIFSL